MLKSIQDLFNNMSLTLENTVIKLPKFSYNISVDLPENSRIFKSMFIPLIY